MNSRPISRLTAQPATQPTPMTGASPRSTVRHDRPLLIVRTEVNRMLLTRATQVSATRSRPSVCHDPAGPEAVAPRTTLPTAAANAHIAALKTTLIHAARRQTRVAIWTTATVPATTGVG